MQTTAFVSGLGGRLRTGHLHPVSGTARWQACRSSPIKEASNLSSPSKETSGDSAGVLATWASRVKIDLTSLALYKQDDRPRGMVTIAPRRQGEILVSVPSNLALEVKSLDSKRSPFPEAVGDAAWASLPWYARLAVKLHRTRRGLTSSSASLSEYLELLPPTFESLPFHWSESDLSKLQSTRMSQLVHKQRKTYKAQFDAIVESVTRSESSEPWLKFDEYVWAVECVRSRSFAGEQETAPFGERLRLFAFVGFLATVAAVGGAVPPVNAANGALTAIFALAIYDVLTPRILGLVSGVRLKRYSLVPGVDFINHSSRVNGKAEVSYEYFSDKFVVAAGENYKAKEEVAISYGAQSNDSLLQYYGFVEKDNPADDYCFDSQIGEMMGVPNGVVARQGVGFDDATIEQVSKRFNGDRKAACLTLADLCRAELAGLPSTLEEDQKVVPSSYQERLAVAYRVEKKRVLLSAQQAMELAGSNSA